MTLLASYAFKTKPHAHQYDALAVGGEREYFGYTMEQGTGKTKVTIDNAAMLYCAGRINALVVIAPNGVHRKWIKQELPKHLPDYIPRRAAWWASTASKAERMAMEDMYTPGPELRVYSFNIEAFTSPRGIEEIKRFLRCTQAMLVVDESSRIKTPSSKRTKAVVALRLHAPYRRILTGTPVTQSPLDVFSQMQFLSPDVFDTESYTIFRARYAELMSPNHPLVQAIVRKNNLRFTPTMIATDDRGKPIYKNLEELREIVGKHTFRVLKKDCLDLPPKTYSRRVVEWAPEQKTLYATLIRRVKTGLLEGESVTKPLNKLNVLTYAQQILCGVVPKPLSPDGQNSNIFDDPAKNPRIKAMLAEIAETDEQVIVWCRFTLDIHNVTQALADVYGQQEIVQYYGEIKDADRDQAVAAFQSHKVRFFVGNPEAAGIGLDLFEGTSVHYYSNSFKLESRLQSEDRSHRIGTPGRVLYTDYEVEDSCDTRIIDALLSKKDVADLITGDEVMEWL